ncbi:MAG TPA: WbqC family protein [Cyclobacteriaceae bacterium]|nr:WbqC family protein [Cyclobacteriaceae bacterium]HRJ83285.1 WbqC family protein [Cyclobacteriaceae bacterium]
MIVSIHQPHFLPWLGYFNKVWNSDVFVWLHNVQYRKNYFQSRTRLKNPHTLQEFWLTVPVRASLGMAIDEVVEVNDRWRKPMAKTLEQFYKKTPYFQELGLELINLVHTCDANLDKLNYQFFLLILDKLNFPGKIVRVEELLPVSEEPNQRLIDICEKIGATRYIAGKGGKNYVNAQQWNKAGIEVIWQDFQPAQVRYPQQGNNFIPGLSVIDCLFNTGIDETRRLIEAAWQVKR